MQIWEEWKLKLNTSTERKLKSITDTIKQIVVSRPKAAVVDTTTSDSSPISVNNTENHQVNETKTDGFTAP